MIGSTKQECLVELNFRGSFDCCEARKKLRLQVESYEVKGSSSGAHGDNQVRSTWRFDAWTNSRWWIIFAKVEFVEFVSNIICTVGLRLDLCCIVDRIRVVSESDSCSLGLLYKYGGCHTM